MQKLILPVKNFRPSAGYKNAVYRKRWAYTHFGVDCGDFTKDRALYGMGVGIVRGAGLDGLNGRTTGAGSGCGFVLIVEYDNCYNWMDGKIYDVVVTYMHMAAMPLVKVGDLVTKKTLLGYYGSTGVNTTGPHLHFQMDTDIKFPKYACGISKDGHAYLKHVAKGGNIDSTMNPAHFLHIGAGQQIKMWTKPEDLAWMDATDFTMIPTTTGPLKKAAAVVGSTGRVTIK